MVEDQKQPQGQRMSLLVLPQWAPPAVTVTVFAGLLAAEVTADRWPRIRLTLAALPLVSRARLTADALAPAFLGPVHREQGTAMALEPETRAHSRETPPAVVLAGPTEGLPDCGRAAFRAAARRLRQMGYEVYDPSAHEYFDSILGNGNRASLADDLRVVAEEDIDMAVVLPGWEVLPVRASKAITAAALHLGIAVRELRAVQDGDGTRLSPASRLGQGGCPG